MATPHVAGAWAIMRQAYGDQAIDTELDFLKTTGQVVVDNRTGSAATLSRIRLGPAAGIVNPAPVLSSVTPNAINAGRDTNITVSGTGFVRSSIVIADGVTIPTTFVSDTELQAVVPKSMLGPSTNSISVFVESPPLGGGASAALAITVLQPEIALDATTVDLGATVTATLTSGPGNQYDWMVLVPVGAPSSGWLKMTFVPPYQTGMVWNVAMPTTAGRYEIRLLEHNTYNILATSETITVGDVVEPPPSGGDPAIALSATGRPGRHRDRDDDRRPRQPVRLDGVGPGRCAEQRLAEDDLRAGLPDGHGLECCDADDRGGVRDPVAGAQHVQYSGDQRNHYGW
jgi:hypothetical protein